MSLTKEIYLIRHGETDYNLKKIVQGRGVDSELNKTGRNQAFAFFKRYSNVEFDHVYISELQRTQQTVQHFIDLGIPTTKSEALDEINWGIYEGVMPDPEMHQRYLSIIQKWRDGDLGIKIDGGESAMDLWERQEPFMEILKNMPYKRVLACSHGRSIRSLLCKMTNTPLEQMDDFSHTNTCLYKLSYSLGEFKIDIFNNIDHLNEAV